MALREAAGAGGETIYRQLSEGKSRWSCVRRRATAARPTPDETGAEFHGAPPIVRAEYAPDGRKALVIAARAAHIAKRHADRCLGVPWRDALAEALLPEAIQTATTWMPSGASIIAHAHGARYGRRHGGTIDRFARCWQQRGKSIADLCP